MVSPLEVVGWLAMGLVSLGYVAIARQTWRRDDFPGRTSFVTACLLMGGLLSVLAVLMAVARVEPGGALAVLAFLLVFLVYAFGMVVPLAWVRFALRFTGQRIPTDRGTFVRIGAPVVVALGVLACLTVVTLSPVLVGTRVVPDRYLLLLNGGFEYTVALTTFYLASLQVAGASLIGWSSYTYRHLSTTGGALLGVGFVLPWGAVAMPEVAGLFQEQPVLMLYHGLAGGVVGVCATWAAVSRHGLFDEVPAAGTVGREVTVEEMTDPVVVVDTDRRILDLNGAAERAFDASAAAIGRPLAALFPGPEPPTDAVTDAGESVELDTRGRTYEATTSELRDEHGDLLGHSVVFRDVTDRKRREQRIQVLNRVLRHNLRNDMNAVNGYAQLLVEETDGSDHARRIRDIATELTAVGEKARRIEAVVASDEDHATAPLPEVVRGAVAEVRAEHDDCRIDVDVPAERADGDWIGVDADVDEPVVSAVVAELVENAVEHGSTSQPDSNGESGDAVEHGSAGGRPAAADVDGPGEDDPVVDVTVTVDADADRPFAVTVADDGPGIPAAELAPIRDGSETALEHGSGLGLWLVNWGVSRLDGAVEFAAGDPRGTVVTLRLGPAGREAGGLAENASRSDSSTTA